MRVLVLLNENSGTLAASQTCDEPDRIRRAFEDRGVETVVRCVQGSDLTGALAEARDQGFDALVAGGGDGTLNTIANALAGGRIPFAVLPLGTHNHFAKELNVPLDLDAAAVALADATVAGRVTDLDVGEVNGRVFLNFSAIGLHPEVVKERDVQQEAMGGTKVVGRLLRKAVKVWAGLVAFFRRLARLKLLQVRITGGGRSVRRVTPSVIVCNNAHQMGVFGVQNLSCLDRKVLNVYVAKAKGSVGVLRLMVKAMLRQLDADDAHEFEAVCLPEVRISLRRRHLPVSIDGEVVDLKTPLEYRVRRGGLKVIVPDEVKSAEY